MIKINKKLVWVFIISLCLVSLMNAQESEKKATGKIYFLRSTGFAGSAAAFKIFIDNEFVCKLNNKKFSIHEVPVGKHLCSVQFGGTKSKERAEKFEVQVEADKITYVQLVFETGLFVNNVYCEEVTENTAKHKIANMKEDGKCL